MMRACRILFASWLVLSASIAVARSQELAPCPDLRDTPWQEDEIGVGVTLRQHRFEQLFGSPQSVSVLVIERTNRDRYVRVANPEPFARVATSKLAAETGALAAINGGFFDTKNGTPIGLVKIDGEVVSPGKDSEHAAIAVDRRERTMIEGIVASETLPDARYALAAHPRLLRKGSPAQAGGWGDNDRRHPRSAAGITRQSDLLLVTVDGRTADSAGMTFWELARLMEALGCEEAMNLDGGGSTTLWAEGRGIVNFPCDNKLYDHAGERSVANAVLVFAPAIIRLDEERAELVPADGWDRAIEDRRSIGGDCAESASSEAIARFEFTAGRDGTFELQLHAPTRGSASSVLLVATEGRDQRISMPSAGRWVAIDDFSLATDGVLLVEVRAGDDRPLRVDALRLVQAH